MSPLMARLMDLPIHISVSSESMDTPKLEIFTVLSLVISGHPKPGKVAVIV